jgi:hypothetical protein
MRYAEATRAEAARVRLLRLWRRAHSTLHSAVSLLVSHSRSLVLLYALLPLSARHSRQLLSSLAHLLHLFLYHGADTKETFFALLPADFHPSLRGLLARLMLTRLPEWREELLNSMIGPAKLVDFDWRVDLVTSSSSLAAMAAAPTVMLEMKTQPPPTSTNLMQPLESLQFEMTPQALATLLNGLEKIQSQLSAMN